MQTLLGKISEDLLIPKERLDYLISSAPYRYKVYKIPKKSKSGKRTIAQPAKEVKKLQYWVIQNIFPKFPVHNSATAYVSGKSISDNANAHNQNPYILKLDFVKFFPSIKAKDFLHYAQSFKEQRMLQEDLHNLVKILFWAPKDRNELLLSIGAPSSPQLSNILLYQFDSLVSDYCSKQEIIYTRYADDLTFSMEKKEFRGSVHQKIVEILSQLPSLKLKLNDRKTVYASKAHRRMVTGLIITNDGKTSLGRNRKRLIRAKIHHFLNNKLPDNELPKLIGILSFAKDIEPEFIKRMERKYGKGLLKRLNDSYLAGKPPFG